MRSIWFKIYQRETLLQLRQIRYLINYCLFFLMLLLIFPMTLKPEVALLRSVLPGVIWIAALLSMLLSAEQLFQQDEDQGVIEQWILSGASVALIVHAKVMAHWLFSVLPILILSPLIAILYSLNLGETCILVLSLLCGTPVLLFLSALAASFGLGMNQKSALMALILLPLTLPVLIFGSGTITLVMQGSAVSGHLALLAAMSLISVTFLPFAIAGVLSINS